MRRKILIGIIFTGLILRFIGLNQSFWLDEAAQVIESERVFAQQIDLASDFHTPLYHILLHFWLKIGKSCLTLATLNIKLSFHFNIINFFYNLAQKTLNQQFFCLLVI